MVNFSLMIECDGRTVLVSGLNVVRKLKHLNIRVKPYLIWSEY